MFDLSGSLDLVLIYHINIYHDTDSVEELLAFFPIKNFYTHHNLIDVELSNIRYYFWMVLPWYTIE